MNVPKLRFPEFSGEWEEKKLADIALFSKGKGYTKNDLQKNGTPIILYGRMYTKYETIIDNVDTFVNMQNGSVISKGGEIIVPASGETAEEISRALVVKNKGIILGGDLNIISIPTDKFSSSFLALNISNGDSQRKLSKLAQGKSVVHLHNEDLSNLEIKIPSLPEQQKIAYFLSTVDSIIASETKILNALQKKKKALMQKLFSQQLRFKADDGSEFPEWVEKKLGDCVINISSGKNKNKSATGNYPVYGSMGIIGYTENYKYEKDCILIARVGANAGVLNVAVGKYDVSDNTLILNLQKNEILKFYYYRLMFMNLNKLNYGTGQPLVTSGMLQKLDINLPCKEEQQKIADCLSGLNNLIQNQQKIVTKWQQRKKGLLQGMFV